jgi:hypothetical protein
VLAEPPRSATRFAARSSSNVGSVSNPVDTTTADPASRTAASWSARYAALKSRGVEDTDPRAAECVAALSFWRLKRSIDAEVAAGHVSATYADAVTTGLRDQARQAVTP